MDVQGDEEPIEDFIDVPSLPSHDAEEDTRDRPGEKSRGRSQFKRLKRLYQPETGATSAWPAVC